MFFSKYASLEDVVPMYIEIITSVLKSGNLSEIPYGILFSRVEDDAKYSMNKMGKEEFMHYVDFHVDLWNLFPCETMYHTHEAFSSKLIFLNENQNPSSAWFPFDRNTIMESRNPYSFRLVPNKLVHIKAVTSCSTHKIDQQETDG